MLPYPIPSASIVEVADWRKKILDSHNATERFLRQALEQMENTAASFDFEPSAKAEPWICGSCTLQNDYDVVKCAVCKTNRPMVEQETTWGCPECTFANQFDDSTCGMCGTPNPTGAAAVRL